MTLRTFIGHSARHETGREGSLPVLSSPGLRAQDDDEFGPTQTWKQKCWPEEQKRRPCLMQAWMSLVHLFNLVGCQTIFIQCLCCVKVSLPKSYVEILTPKVRVLGGGAFER